MNDKLTRQDYELISAYLDNSCSPKERRLLEERLKVDPEFAQVLREFKHAKRLLREMPVKPVPHNFTLKASQAPAHPQRFSLALTLNFVSVAALLLLFVVFGGSHLIPGFMGQQTASRAAAAPMAFSAAMPASTSESTPMIITWGQGVSADSVMAKGLGGGGSTNGGTYSVPQTLPLMATEGTAEATEAVPQGELLTAPQATGTTQATDDTSSLILGIPDKADQGKVISPTATEVEIEQVNGAPSIDLTWIEVSLGALAAVAAALAWLLRRMR